MDIIIQIYGGMMADEDKNIVGFIDILGTGYLAQRDPDKYYANLSRFQNALTGGSAHLSIPDKVYCFSDCAYVQSADPTRLLRYLIHVRSTLLNDQVYIKAALARGTLAPSSVHRREQIVNPEKLKKREEIVSGTAFGRDVVKAYALQDTLKSIGIRIDSSLLEDHKLKHAAVVSCHFPYSNSLSMAEFWDLRLDKADLRVAVLKQALWNCLKANSKARKAGRYYIGLLVTFARSIDWARVEPISQPRSQEDQPITDCGQALLSKLTSGYFDRHFSDVNGIECLLFTILNEVYSRAADPKVVDLVQDCVARHKRLTKAMINVPDGILSSENKDRFLERKLRIGSRTVAF